LIRDSVSGAEILTQNSAVAWDISTDSPKRWNRFNRTYQSAPWEAIISIGLVNG